MKVIIDDKIPYIKGALESVAGVVYFPGGKISHDDLLDVDAMIIRTRTKCTEQLLEGTPVKFIATATIGHDHIDTAYCEKAGIRWTNAPGCNSGSVEQYIVSALLCLSGKNNFQLKGKTLGVIGVGNVGSKVVRAAKVLGCRVLMNDPPRAGAIGLTSDDTGDQGNPEAFVSLEKILKEADIVTVHVPLNREGKYRTVRLADEQFFSQMKQGAIFINTSRGEVVDQEALKNALRNGLLSDAVLDVFAGEPEIDRELLDMLALATPHIAGYSADGKANGTAMSVQAVSREFGLGLDDWAPREVPEPHQKEIFADGADDDAEALIREVYDATYRISEDHQRLMNDPAAFELLRGTYPVRREPQAYSARVFNDDGKYRAIFENLRFNVIGDSCM